MNWKLRLYQKRWCRAIANTFRRGPEGHPMKRILGVAATGAGKTIMASALIWDRQQREERCLFLADTDELCDQAIDKIEKATGIITDLEKASRYASPAAGVVVASIQSISSQKRLDRFAPDHFNLVIADEAHLSLSASWQRVLKHFAAADILGITATPERGDKRSLLKFYEHVAAEISLVELINERQLSPITVQTVPLRIAVASEITGADDNDAVAQDIEPYWRGVIEAIHHYAADRKKILVFHPSVDASQRFTHLALEMGIKAMHVDGKSHDRTEVVQMFAQGEFRMLSNAQLLIKGYDCPDIDCIIPLRPTKSRGQYIQMVGRGTRIFCPHACAGWCEHPDRKKDMLLLDFLWEFASHNVMGPADLVTDAPEQKAAVAKKLKEEDNPLDLIGLDRDITDEREQRLIKAMQEAARRRANRFDARTWAAAMHQPELIEYEPLAKWEAKPPTEKQLEILAKCKVDPESVTSRGMASKLLDVIFQRREKKLCTPAQMIALAKFGIDASEMQFDEASAHLDELIGDHRPPPPPCPTTSTPASPTGSAGA